MVTVIELYTARQLELPHDMLASSWVCPSAAMTIEVGNVLCSWNAASNFSVITCVVAAHTHPGVTIVTVAVTGTNTVVPLRTGEPC